MLTGQNGTVLTRNPNDQRNCFTESSTSFKKNISEKKGLKTHLTIFKDFSESEIAYAETADFMSFKFSTQPIWLYH
jgi:hypothetical protein